MVGKIYRHINSNKQTIIIIFIIITVIFIIIIIMLCLSDRELNRESQFYNNVLWTKVKVKKVFTLLLNFKFWRKLTTTSNMIIQHNLVSGNNQGTQKMNMCTQSSALLLWVNSVIILCHAAASFQPCDSVGGWCCCTAAVQVILLMQEMT